MTTITIAGRAVGDGNPCYVIAEAGVNHNGSPDLAHQLIEASAACGADAVKFQAFDPGAVVAGATEPAPYQKERGATSQLELLRDLMLPESCWSELAQQAHELELHFLCTAFDDRSAELVAKLGVPAMKVPSGELDNLAFIRRLAAFGRPMLISTGMSDLSEVAAAVQAAKTASGIALFHCVTAYPASIGSANLRAIRTMKDEFDVPVGWSDHTEGEVAAVASVALGASLLEKHITLDRSMSGPDHRASADPEQFTRYVQAVRAAESALGDGIKRPVPEEEVNAPFVRRSWHALRDLVPGERLDGSNVRLVRPSHGLPAGAVLSRYVLANAVAAGTPVTEADVIEEGR